MEVDYHFIREKVVRKDLLIRYVASEDQTADIFTKGLSAVRFNKLKTKLNVKSLQLILRGRNRENPAVKDKRENQGFSP